jgi:hypothetical protein
MAEEMRPRQKLIQILVKIWSKAWSKFGSIPSQNLVQTLVKIWQWMVPKPTMDLSKNRQGIWTKNGD